MWTEKQGRGTGGGVNRNVETGIRHDMGFLEVGPLTGGVKAEISMTCC